jgi:uncharacterized membrane protein
MEGGSMMWWNHSWGFGWGWILIMGVAMVACVAVMARMMMGHSAGRRMWPAGNHDQDAPERILARRLASDEIDVAEFERLRDALRQTSNSTTEAEPGPAGRRSPLA